VYSNDVSDAIQNCLFSANRNFSRQLLDKTVYKSTNQSIGQYRNVIKIIIN